MEEGPWNGMDAIGRGAELAEMDRIEWLSTAAVGESSGGAMAPGGWGVRGGRGEGFWGGTPSPGDEWFLGVGSSVVCYGVRGSGTTVAQVWQTVGRDREIRRAGL